MTARAGLLLALVAAQLGLLALMYMAGSARQQTADWLAFRQETRAFYQRKWAQAPAGVTVLLGDSHIQSLDGLPGVAPTINLGIGGERLADAHARLADYPDLGRAARIIVCLGANDALQDRPISQIGQDLTRLVDDLPPRVTLIVLEIPPVSQKMADFSRVSARIRSINQLLQSLCAGSRCKFVSFPELLRDKKGALSTAADSGDHLHLSTEGNHHWSSVISNAAISNEVSLNTSNGTTKGADRTD